ncbi:hypothetical protein AVEN_205837-1 [Araneus ventricosus]|uniref:Uncharacterized protein n=1 Tax=Araneus ventricosus TaxID=182803 RepID=A0A4Y2HDY2_ARAVE|nr:hypothetical protein AVEN_205837-1 [Araneus ventricosus]
MRSLIAPPVANYRISVPIWKTVRYRRKKVHRKVVQHHRFSTKRHFMDINRKDKTLETRIYLFAISKTVTSQNVNKKRKCCPLGKNVPNGPFPVEIPQTAGVYYFSANTALRRRTDACAKGRAISVQHEIQARVL